MPFALPGTVITQSRGPGGSGSLHARVKSSLVSLHRIGGGGGGVSRRYSTPHFHLRKGLIPRYLSKYIATLIFTGRSSSCLVNIQFTLLHINHFIIATIDFGTCTKIFQYFQADSKGKDDIVRPLSRNQRKNFRLKIEKFSILDRTLCRDGKIVLHGLDVTPVLRNLHKSAIEHQGNCRGLHREAHSRYFIEWNLLVSCQNVCFECIECAEARMILSDEVLMRHLTAKTRERICRTIMTPVKKAKTNCSHKPRVPVFVAGKKPIATQDGDSLTSLPTNQLQLKVPALFLPVYWIA